MAWKTSSVMDEKLQFVFEYERDEETTNTVTAPPSELARQPPACDCPAST
ncbi:MAG: hypothetical protein ACLGP3_08300 [Acidobacteriota bacterium]